VLPGLGVGRIQRGMGRFGGPASDAPGHFQLIYTDGLNTISVVQIPMGRLMEIRGDPGRIQAILDSKSREVRRIFHTSMVARVMPRALVILYGEVAPDVLRQVADSIGLPEGFPPEGMRPPLPEGEEEGRPRPPFNRPGAGPRRDRPGFAEDE